MKKSALLSTILLVIILIGYNIASDINTGNGSVEFTKVTILGERANLSGFLYIPDEAHSVNPLPAVLLTHGISNSKETLTGLAIELSRRGLVCLCLDLYGHGLSEGQLGINDPSIGVLSGVEYLGSLDYVDENRLALVGHSLGAGAVRAASNYPGVLAVAFIGGGISAGAQEVVGILNSTTPRNLLFVVGSNDILFNVDNLKEELAPIFGIDDLIVLGKNYGNKTEGTGRMLSVSPTIHLLEPVDGKIVRSVTTWMLGSLQPEKNVDNNLLKYPQRDNGNLISLLAFMLLVFPISEFLWKTSYNIDKRKSNKISLKLMAFWSVIGLVLFIPAMAVGAVIQFPPQIFGSSLAWWLLVSGFVGLIVLRFRSKIITVSEILFEFRMKNVIIGVTLFLILYLTVYSVESYYGIGFMYIIPFFRSLNVQRMQLVPAYLPFFLFYFTVEGLYLYTNDDDKYSTNWYDFLKPSLIKASPYLLLLFLQYGGMYFFNVRLIPGFLGFFLEFLWGILPIFAVTTLWSGWLRKITGNMVVGVILNTLVVSWIAATTFPFGAFF